MGKIYKKDKLIIDCCNTLIYTLNFYATANFPVHVPTKVLCDFSSNNKRKWYQSKYDTTQRDLKILID